MSKPKFRKVRARITLRKRLVREPTVVEIYSALASVDKFSMEAEEILPEFEGGREVCSPISFICYSL